MNIEQAKQIPLRRIVEAFGGRYAYQKKENEDWYYSPFRPNERTPSFKVNLKNNKWWDFGSGQGGSSIDLCLDYNNQNRNDKRAVSATLKILQNFLSQAGLQLFQSNKRDYNSVNNSKKEINRFILLKEPGRIYHDGLLREIGRRGLSLATVTPYLKQAQIKDIKTKKKYYGFAFFNDAGGWEISIPNPHKGECFKTCAGKKAPTTIIGEDKTRIEIFEGFWDWLTWLHMNKQIKSNSSFYILNSLSFVSKISEKIIDDGNEQKTILLFFDNDISGVNSTFKLLDLLTRHNFKIGTKNELYADFKDLNSYWVHSCIQKKN